MELENNCLIFGVFLAQTNHKLNRKTEALKMVGIRGHRGGNWNATK